MGLTCESDLELIKVDIACSTALCQRFNETRDQRHNAVLHAMSI